MSHALDTRQIAVTLPDGVTEQFPAGVTVAAIARQALGEDAARNVIAAAVRFVSAGTGDASNHNEPGAKPDDPAQPGGSDRYATEAGEVIVDTHEPLAADVTLRFVTPSNPEALKVLRHSAAHVMADAIQRVFPGTLLWVGPAIDDGYYYDVDLGDDPDTGEPRRIVESDLARIEKAMREIAKARLPFARRAKKRIEALAEYRERGDTYKVDLLERIPDDEVSFYAHGDRFEDLCVGPHLPHTGFLRAFKLLKVAGAHFKGDASNRALDRVYGTAFFHKSALTEYLKRLEEAKRRDHRRLGTELDLFSFHPEAPAQPFFHPRGVAMMDVMLAYARDEHARRGYEMIATPQVLSESLWHTSGHMDNYADNMFFTEVHGGEGGAGRRFALKPMNCPGGILYYKTKHHSYRELPLRIAELGRVHRQEKSGVVHGMLRVKAFTQDDAHIYCRRDQIESEVEGVLDFVLATYRLFGFTDVRLELSTRPEKSIGSDADWAAAEAALEGALERFCPARELAWSLNPGDGAFYGPKIDCHVRDALGRSWQIGTIQVDFALPQRFGLGFVDSDGERKPPIMIHRAIFGSFERFLGLMIEHHAGEFPTWLAPVQVQVLTVTEGANDYAAEVLRALSAAGVRAEADVSKERIGKKIALARKARAPYCFICGERESAERTVNVRRRGARDSESAPLDAAIAAVSEEGRRPPVAKEHGRG